MSSRFSVLSESVFGNSFLRGKEIPASSNICLRLLFIGGVNIDYSMPILLHKNIFKRGSEIKKFRPPVNKFKKRLSLNTNGNGQPINRNLVFYSKQNVYAHSNGVVFIIIRKPVHNFIIFGVIISYVHSCTNNKIERQLNDRNMKRFLLYIHRRNNPSAFSYF